MKKVIQSLAGNQSGDLLVLTTLHIFNDGFRVSLLLLLPFIAKDLSLDLTTVGVFGGVLNAMGIILALPSGYLAARIGGMKVLIIAIALYGIGFVLTGFVATYYVLFLAFFIAGIGFGSFHPIGAALVAKISSPTQIGRQMGSFFAAGEIGKISIASAVTLFVGYLGWRYTAGVYGLVAIILAIFLFFVLLKNVHKDHIKEDKPPAISVKTLLKQKLYTVTLIAGFFDTLANAGLILFMPFFLLEKGAESYVLGVYAAVFFLGNFIGKTVLGRVVDHFGSSNVFIASEVGMIISLCLFVWLPLSPFLYIVAFVLGLFTFGTVPAIQTMVSEASLPSQYEKSFALNSLVGSIGTTFAPLIMGVISDVFSLTTAFYLMAAFAFAAVLPAICLWGMTKRK